MMAHGAPRDAGRDGHITEYELKLAARGDTWDNKYPVSAWSTADWEG